MSIQNFLANRPSVQNYLAHPFAAREAAREFANNPESAKNPSVLGVLAQHHEQQAAHHEAKAQKRYSASPELGAEASERATFSSLAQARGHREAANILRGLL